MLAIGNLIAWETYNNCGRLSQLRQLSTSNQGRQVLRISVRMRSQWTGGSHSPFTTRFRGSPTTIARGNGALVGHAHSLAGSGGIWCKLFCSVPERRTFRTLLVAT